MNRAKYPSQEWLKSRFTYNDGHLYHLQTHEIVKEYAGSTTNKYKSILIGQNGLCLHRLIYIFHFGDGFDQLDIDHINRDPTDNRIENLRACTRSLNACNAKPRTGCKSGVRGISTRASGKWAVMVCGMYLGQFDTLATAIRIREEYISTNVR